MNEPPSANTPPLHLVSAEPLLRGYGALRDRAAAAVARYVDDVLLLLDDGSLVSMESLRTADSMRQADSDLADIASLVHPDDRASCDRWLAEMLAGRQIGERRAIRITDGTRYRLKELTSVALEPRFGPPTVDVVLLTKDVDGRVDGPGSMRARHPDGFGVSAHLSHELRSPLTAILGFGSILITEATTESQREAAQYVVRAGEHVLSMLDALVTAASDEHGRGEPRELDALAIFREASHMLMPLARARGITFVYEPGSTETAYADAVLVRQIAVNLISNAVKYNRPGGEVRLRVDSTSEEFVRVCVSDDGIGIDPSRRARLFVPFDRLDVEILGIKGEGIGLALSRRLANAMGGEIGADANEGPGTTFWLELRRSPLGADPVEVRTQEGVRAS